MIDKKLLASLRQRRKDTESLKGQFLSKCHHCSDPSRCTSSCAQGINTDIIASWRRCPENLLHELGNTPLEETYLTQLAWEASPLRLAAAPELENIRQLSKENAIAAAISDASGKFLWTTASAGLQKFTDSINFITGASWAERDAGTNAISLALAHKRSCTVFAAEHFAPVNHDLVCYAAPIVHPQSGQIAGAIDISMSWKQHSSLTEKAVGYMANAIAKRLPPCQPRAELEIHALGAVWVLFRGQRLHLSQRQLEILCILALHPAGMTLDAVHHALHGNANANTSTIKSILTQLRQLLDGQVGSQPYRLLMPVWADFLVLPNALRVQHMDEALALYLGELLSASTAPAIEEWRNHLDAGMEALLLNCKNPQTLLESAGNLLCTPLVRERFLELLA
ncbi:MAG: transcriptional regulator [Thiothrix sp.]|uniref:transcriptional regulator n=1 Tax=Thiothrix sp. TaxID=1032 RepID=UPI0026035970|nr:transcriptional regulator [Thiothrix sp.]MDD5394802.1 transcriptional regulator [Thiothrix sp.]